MKKIAYFIFIIPLCLFLVGCSGTEQITTSNRLSSCIDKLSESLKDIPTISTSDLIINEIMGSEDIAIIATAPLRRFNNPTNKTGYNGATYTGSFGTPSNKYLGSYINKLYLLHNNASNTIRINNNIQYLKSEIQSKCSVLKSLNNEIKHNKIKLTESQCKSIDDLLSNLNTYTNRINLAKSEINTELNSVKKLKSNYSNNIEQLSSKYTRLSNCLDIRCSYYSNVIDCLDNIYNNIINGDINNLVNDYINNEDVIEEQYSTICKDGKCYEYKNGELINESYIDNNVISEENIQVSYHRDPNYEYNDLYNNPNNYGNYYNYGNGYRGFWGNNINTYRSIRNINTMDPNYNSRIKNTDTFKNISSNIDSFRNGKNYKPIETANNPNDPYKVMPEINVNSKTHNDNLEDKDIKEKLKNLETKKQLA